MLNKTVIQKARRRLRITKVKFSILLPSITLAFAASLNAQVLSDDFATGPGRLAGTSLAGAAIQKGSGTWAQGALAGNQKFVTGGGITETGPGGGSLIGWTQPTSNVFSMAVDITPNDFGVSGDFTIGFFETINKSYLTNVDVNNLISLRYIQSGPNRGKFEFRTRNEGVESNTLGGPATTAGLGNTDTIRLTLDYNPATGRITGSAYNVTDGVLISSGTHTVAGLTGMNNVAFGWSNIPDQTSSPSATPGIVSHLSVVSEPSVPAFQTDAISDGKTGGSLLTSTTFQHPPDSTKPGVYWYWLRDNISKEGITKDLEAMKRVGIGRAYIGNVDATPIGRGSVKMFSDEWWEATRHAIREGGRLGVDIGVFNCPGWSQSGGPWVKPDQSMRYLSVSETKVHGPGKFEAVLPVPAKPFTDVAVLAVPEEPEHAKPVPMKGRVTTWPAADGTALFDGNPASVCSFPDGGATKEPFIVEIEYPQNITARSITIVPDRVQLKVSCELQYRDQSGEYRSVKKFTMERLSKNSIGPMLFGPVAEAFPAVTAGKFRLVFTGLLAGAKAANQKPGIAEILLSESPRLERYVEKQLGQMFPSPHAPWDAYLWEPQAGSNEGALSIPATQVRNIGAFMDSGGKLVWDVPEGNWTILRVGMVPTGVQNDSSPIEGRGMEADKMNAAHVRAHFDAYLGKLADRLSPEERKGWKYVIVDSYEKGSQNWTDNLQDEFRSRYHYDPLPWLPVLTGRLVDNPDRSDRFLWDLRRLVADKVATDYAGTLREATHERGLKLWMENYGHFGFPGEDLQYGGAADEVAGEFWAGGGLGSFEPRIAASSAHIHGKPVVSAESFTFGGTPWSQTPWSLKQRGDWAMAEGVNQFVLHLFIHQSVEKAPGINAWFGTEFNRHNTWFDYMDGWIASFRRTQAVLQQGHYVADLAYFTGEDAPKETGILDPALPPGYDYDYINGETIRRDLQVKDGRFVLPDGMEYRLLVLPPLETMRPELLRKIGDLVRAGGAVLGEPPSRSPSMENYPACDEQVRKLAGELWEGIDGKKTTSGRYGKGFVFRGSDAATALAALGVAPDIEGIGERPAFGKEEGFAWIHRRTDDAEIYFLSNQSDRQKSISVSFRVNADAPELWDPVTGEMRALPQFTREAGRVRVPLEFLPRQSYLVAFRKAGNLPVPASRNNFSAFDTVLNLNPAWDVTFDPKWGGPGTVRFDQLVDWTTCAEDGIKYYSGTAVYRSTFNFEQPVSGRYFLNLGAYNSIARVKLNGTDIGVVWTKPGRIEITAALKPGANELEIDVANTWNNRLLGDSKLPAEQRITWTNVDAGIKSHTKLQPSGLTGLVTIEKLQQP